MGFKLISCYRTRSLIGAVSIGLFIGTSFGAAYLGTRLAEEAASRKSSIRLMQLSAQGLSDEPSLEELDKSSQGDDLRREQIRENAMALAIRYTPDVYGQLNTSFSQTLALSRISEDVRQRQIPHFERASFNPAADQSALSLRPAVSSSNLIGEDDAKNLMPKKLQTPMDTVLPPQTLSKPLAKPLATPLAASPLVMAKKTQSDLDCLSTAVYYEARGEGTDGMRAVAQVILNRVRHAAYPKTICGVVYQGSHLRTGCQFSFTCNGAMVRGPRGWVWERARSVASDALNGQVYRPVGTSTHFHTRQVSPVWAPRLVRVATVGMHIFYQLPGRGSRLQGSDVVKASLTNEAQSQSITENDRILLQLTMSGSPESVPETVTEDKSALNATAEKEAIKPTQVSAKITGENAHDLSNALDTKEP